MQIVNAYCDKLFSFEVPLEDIFLENDVHPAIKNLFEVSFQSIAKSGFPIKIIISSFQGSLTERFLLKDQLLALGYFSGDEASPGAYLWLIRHFLGLLPLPLLPTRSRDRRQPWHALCALCAKLLNDPSARICSTFCYSIARYINGLPEANRMLLLNLLALFDSLRGSKRDVVYFADYLASAIFVRPYYPGNGIKFCRQGYNFLIFLMINFRALRPLCKTPNGFEVQSFGSKRLSFTKMIRTSLPLLQTEQKIYQKLLLDFDNLKNQSFAHDKEIQCSVSERTVKVSKRSSETTISHSDMSKTNEGKTFYDENIKNKESNFKKQSPPKTKISSQVSGEEEDYIYDEDFKNQENSFSEIATNVGWTFAPPKTSSPRIGWNINKNNYKLSFDNNESESDTNNLEKQSEKRSRLSLHNFLKKIRPSLCSVKKTESLLDAPTNIKYKKMESSKNNSF